MLGKTDKERWEEEHATILSFKGGNAEGLSAPQQGKNHLSK